MRIVKPIETNVVSVYRNEAFDNGFYKYFANRKKNRISAILNNVDRNIKIESITYRQLNSWEAEGLFTVERENGEWRRFSIIDAIWVKLIKELRDFGMSRKQLKVAKESLAFESKRCGVAMPMLEFYTALVIGAKMPVLILVFKDGVTVPCSLTQYKVAKEFVGIENHIQISLNELLQGMYPEIDLQPITKPEVGLTMDEVELLAFMRLKVFEKVEIRYKNGKIDLIEGLENVSNKKRVEEILREQKYSSIELIEEDGVVTRVLRKIKKKIKREAP